MGTPLVPDEPRAVVAPLLPAEPPTPKGGRPRVPDRAAPTGIAFALANGVLRAVPPPGLWCGGGATASAEAGQIDGS